MYRVILRVERVPPDVGFVAAFDIAESFRQRPWHTKAVCSYIDGGLTFESENDFDDDGLATQDEFAHEFSGLIPDYEGDDGNLQVVSIEEF